MKRALLLFALTLAACARFPDSGASPGLSTQGLSGPSDEVVIDLAGHSAGVYAVGITTGDDPFGNPDAFIRNYRSDRSVVWTGRFGTDDFEFVEGVAADGSGNAYVVGSTSGDLAGSQGGDDAFVRKYTPDGRVAWTRQFGTGDNGPPNGPPTGYDFAKGVAVYGQAVYIAGRTDGKLRGSVGDGPLFLRKYTADGRVSWTRQFSLTREAFGFDFETMGDVAVDGGGNAYLVGTTFSDFAGSAGGEDVFVRKYTPGGAARWTRYLDFSGNDFADAVAVSGGSVYVGVGYVANADPAGAEWSIRVVKYSTGGVPARGWGYRHNPAGSETPTNLHTDRDGNIYLAGDNELPGGGNNGLVVKLSPEGVRVWGRRVASAGNDTPNDITNDGVNAVFARSPAEVYVGGLTSGGLGAANRGGLDAFVRRLRGDGWAVWTDQ